MTTQFFRGTDLKPGKNPPTAYLVIPYFNGDNGDRPPPSSYPIWMCRSIKIDGNPYAGQKFSVGQTHLLSLDADNFGLSTVVATCIFYYADPTTSFTAQSPKLIGSANAAMARSSPGPFTTQLGPVSWKIMEGVPEHVCLLASISSVSDFAPPSYNAASDRHWGQQNVYLINLAPGEQIRVPFVMANGGTTTTRFRLEATHVLVNHPSLRHIVGASSVLLRAEVVNLIRTPSDVGQNFDSLDVDLAPNEPQKVELNALVPSDAPPGSTIILQLIQYHGHQPVGGLGVVVHVT